MSDLQEAIVAGLNVVAVPCDAVDPNPWNPNEMDAETFQKECRSIKDNGFVDPLTVRPLGDRWQIIDGEHRWRAAMKEGYLVLPAINLGNISDQRARKLTLIFNELRGRPAPDKLAELVRELARTEALDALAQQLPLNEDELKSLVQVSTQYDWRTELKEQEESSPSVPPQPPPPPPPPQSKTGGTRRFQLGALKVDITRGVSDGLVAAYNATASALSTTDPDVVLREWLRVLGGSESTATPVPAEHVTP